MNKTPLERCPRREKPRLALGGVHGARWMAVDGVMVLVDCKAKPVNGGGNERADVSDVRKQM